MQPTSPNLAARVNTSAFFITNRPFGSSKIALNECYGLLASTEIWAGSGEHLSAIETKLCAPMQWLQSNAGIWALLSRRFVFGQDASQIQRQQLLKLSHNEDFAFGICILIECHHASDYLERCVCSK